MNSPFRFYFETARNSKLGVLVFDSIGRVAADWETAADDAGNSRCFSCSYELVAACPEACTVAWGKSI